MNRRVPVSRALPILVALLSAIAVWPCSAAQMRVSDKDVQQLMKNMVQDSKKFHSLFNSALSRSGIRKTSQAKDAQKLVGNFEKGNKILYDHFKQTRKSGPYLQNSLDTAAPIDQFLRTNQLDAVTVAQWGKIRKELSELAAAFNMPGH